MRRIRKHVTFANVVACLALFIALGGASYAATNLPKNSVGTKQLKKNAVKSAKIAAKAVKTAKIAKGAIATNRLRNGAVTGAKINAPTTPFGQLVETLGGSGPVALGAEVVIYPLASPSYTQPAGRIDQYLGAVDVTFSAACGAPRSAVALLTVDAANPEEPLPQDFVGYAVFLDNGSGEVSRQANFGSYPGGGSDTRIGPAADTPHTFSLLMTGASCKTGSGITATGATIDVIGTK